MTIKEHLEPVIKNLPGLPAQRLHQLLHPPRGIIPAGVTDEHRIPTRRCGVHWARWRHRHDILPRIAEQPLRTLLTDKTADSPGQISPTRGSGPSTGRQKWFRHGPLLRRSPAQPTSGRGCSRPGSTNFKKTTLFLRHETRKKNGSTSCGDVEPSNLRDSCTQGEGRAKRRRKRRFAHGAARFACGTMGSGSQLVGAVPLPATGSGRRAAPQFDGGADLADR